MKINKVILADDHPIVREGIKLILQKNSITEVVFEASNGLEVLDYLENDKADMIVMDLSMPKLNGIFTTEQVKKKYPSIKILILSRHDAEQYILETVKAGADGYVLKRSASEELQTAISEISKGNMYLSPSLSRPFVNKLLSQYNPTREQKNLTHRENEIYQLLAEGYTTKEIAKSLFISTETVSTHRKRVMKKLNVNSISQLTKLAIQSGIIELNIHTSHKD